MRLALFFSLLAPLLGQQVIPLPTIYDRLLSSSARNDIDFSKGSHARMFIEATAPSGACTAADGQKWARATNELWGCKDNGDNTYTWTLISGSSGGSSGGSGAQYIRSTTGNDTYVGCPTTNPTVGATIEGYTRGMQILLDADSGNTGAATINLCSLGVKSILRNTSAALVDGLITANKPILLAYDGTYFVIASPDGTSGVDQLALTKSGSVLTIGANCSSSTPCIIGVGSKPIRVTSAATVTLSGTTASSNAYIGVDHTGIRVGLGSATPTVTCSGCTLLTAPVSAFPDQMVEIGLATFTANVWDTIAGSMDRRQIISVMKVDAGSSGNLTCSTNATTGARECDVASDINLASRTSTVVNKVGTLAARPATCNQGESYFQTDGTAGIYYHYGAAGACAFALKRPVIWYLVGDGGGLNSAESGYYMPSGWSYSTSDPPSISNVGNKQVGLAWGNTTAGYIETTQDIFPGVDVAAGILVRVSGFTNGVGTPGAMTQLVEGRCTGFGDAVNSTTFGTAASLSMTVTTTAYGGYWAQAALTPSGTCTAPGLIKLRLSRNTSDVADGTWNFRRCWVGFVTNLE